MEHFQHSSGLDKNHGRFYFNFYLIMYSYCSYSIFKRMNCRIRLHFFCIQICLHSCLIPGWDMLQIGFKMSPNICLVKNFAKNIVAVIIGLTLCFTTPLKCYSLAFRIMPEMNESKVSKYVVFFTSTLSVLVCAIKFIGVTKPTYNQVSIPCIS